MGDGRRPGRITEISAWMPGSFRYPLMAARVS